ncbi:MAG TPA: metal ABC transporter substrate-binding protein [Bacilli bacterium]|nr:metal ABC transporter substrate-binding protein [Bacilli bacterium]
MKGWIKKLAVAGLGLSLLATATGCTNTESSPKELKEGDKMVIYSSLAPQADFAKEIGKDHVEVHTMLPYGTNFLQWAPIIAEQKKLEKADMLIVNGSGVEDRWLDQTVAQAKIENEYLAVVDATKDLQGEALDLQFYRNPDVTDEVRNAKHVDPYFYMDPVYAKQEVDTILAEMIKKAPVYKDEFTKNADAYKARLDDLDKKYADTLSKVKSKVIVSNYPAWQYTAKRYGLEFHTLKNVDVNDIPQEGTDAEKATTEELKSYDTKVVFFQEKAAPRVAEWLGTRGFMSGQLENFEGQQPAENYAGYIGMMEENLKKFEEGLNL